MLFIIEQGLAELYQSVNETSLIWVGRYHLNKKKKKTQTPRVN